eukprot:860086-Amphidinium_carterae.1
MYVDIILQIVCDGTVYVIFWFVVFLVWQCKDWKDRAEAEAQALAEARAEEKAEEERRCRAAVAAARRAAGRLTAHF